MYSQKRTMQVLMTLLMFAWGLDYIFAKQALKVFEPITLLFFKYCIGLLVIALIKKRMDPGRLIRKKDIPVFILCSLFGEIGYFAFEYTAMDYLPISLITIILAFVPALSIIIDKAVFKRKATPVMVAGIIFCIIGVVLVIGVDYKVLFQGRIIGYLLAFGAVTTWNLYNFITASLHLRYSSLSLTMNQLIVTLLLTWPYAFSHMPEWEAVSSAVIGGVVYLGIFGSGIGFMIQVRALHILGPTTTAMFSNFLPVTATFFGWAILGETISIVQMLGGIVVITAGLIVIKEKGKVEELCHDD